MVIAGDRDEFFTVEEVTELYHLLPKGEMAIIPCSGHAIFQSPDKSTLLHVYYCVPETTSGKTLTKSQYLLSEDISDLVSVTIDSTY